MINIEGCCNEAYSKYKKQITLEILLALHIFHHKPL